MIWTRTRQKIAFYYYFRGLTETDQLPFFELDAVFSQGDVVTFVNVVT